MDSGAVGPALVVRASLLGAVAAALGGGSAAALGAWARWAASPR